MKTIFFSHELKVIDFLCDEHRREFKARIKAEDALSKSLRELKPERDLQALMELLEESLVIPFLVKYPDTTEDEARKCLMNALSVMLYLSDNRSAIIQEAKEKQVNSQQVSPQQELFSKAAHTWNS